MMKRTLFKFLKKKDSPMRLLCEAECLETGAGVSQSRSVVSVLRSESGAWSES